MRDTYMDNLIAIQDKLKTFDAFLSPMTRKYTDENMAIYEHWVDCRYDIEKIVTNLQTKEKCRPEFVYNLSDTKSMFRCSCGENIYVHHDCGLMSGNDAPNYCSQCGIKYDWSEE